MRLALCFLMVFMQTVLFAETVFHLKEKVAVQSGDPLLNDLIEEKLPGDAAYRVRADRIYSNQEVSCILLGLGYRDFILIGNSSDVRSHTTEPAPVAENPVMEIAGEQKPEEDRFFLKPVDRYNGDAVLKKGPITIITRVRIVRRDESGYLVMNPFSGKKFTVPAE